MNTYTVDNLSVNCSLNVGTIYLKVVDTASFATFETKYEPVVASSIEDTHTLMCNCLSKQTHHTCEFHMENSNMRITFDAKVGGYFNVHFDVFLRERTASESGKLGAMIARLETRQNTEMEFIRNALSELQLFTEALSNAEIRVSLGNYPKFAPLNPTTITCDSTVFDTSKVLLFPRLKELNMICNWNGGEYPMSNSVEKLTLLNITHTINVGEILTKFPNLTTLDIGAGCQVPTNATAITRLKHNLKTITLPNGTAEIAEIAQYCAINNIVLIKM
jgi:hypothetical protein